MTEEGRRRLVRSALLLCALWFVGSAFDLHPAHALGTVSALLMAIVMVPFAGRHPS